MPPYPYGANPHFPEANYGLYGGATITSGNKISDGRNKGKTLRHWFPNVRWQHVESKALEQTLYIPVRARVLRTIQKCGGLDEYVMGHKPARIKELGLLGWKLRYLVMRSPSVQEKFRAERRKLGLPEDQDPATETFAEVWNDPVRKKKLLEQQDKAWAKMKEMAENWTEHSQKQWGIESKTPLNPTLQKSGPPSKAEPLQALGLEEPSGTLDRAYEKAKEDLEIEEPSRELDRAYEKAEEEFESEYGAAQRR